MDIPAGVTQEEGQTGFFIHLTSAVRALIFLAKRIQLFLSLVDREVKFLCTNGFNRSPLIEQILIFYFVVRKIPFTGIELMCNVSESYEVTSELPGRPPLALLFYARALIDRTAGAW